MALFTRGINRCLYNWINRTVLQVKKDFSVFRKCCGVSSALPCRKARCAILRACPLSASRVPRCSSSCRPLPRGAGFFVSGRDHDSGKRARMRNPAAAMSETLEPNTPDRMVDLPRLVQLARRCPCQYPQSGDWREIPANIELSIALGEEGFPFLSKAVLEGREWAQEIASAETLQSLAWSEEEASSPGWSWNSEASTD